MIRYSSGYSGQCHYHKLDMKNAGARRSSHKVNKGNSYMKHDVCLDLNHCRIEFQILAHLNITAGFFLV